MQTIRPAASANKGQLNNLAEIRNFVGLNLSNWGRSKIIGRTV